MRLQISKYHGTGNDHILIDDREGLLHDITDEHVRQLCHRKFGIGSDGLILLRTHDVADVDMVFYNPDASQSFCGNGSRCLLAFCEKLGIPVDDISFNAIDAIHTGRKQDNSYAINMGAMAFSSIESIGNDLFLDTGSPHYVVFEPQVEDLDLVPMARAIRYNERFKSRGTNVNFVQVEKGLARVRTYERGVEDETLSCGTGVTAVALAVASKGMANDLCKVETPGGALEVRFTRTEQGFEDVWMIGPAVHVFDAEIEL